MYKPLLLLLIGCNFITNENCLSQTYTLYGDKTFGTPEGEVEMYINNIGNNQLLLSGRSNAMVGGDKTDSLCLPINPLSNTTDLWLIKIDTNLNILWNYSVGGNYFDIFPSQIVSLQNGSFIIVSQSKSDISCEKSENNRSYPSSNYDFWMYKFDTNGSKIWDKTYGGTDAEDVPKIVELNDGNLIVCGRSTSLIDGDKTAPPLGDFDYWIIKTDALGNKIWDYAYGGFGFERSEFGLIADSNNCFLLAGSTISQAGGTITDSSRGIDDIWIAKIDSSGNILFDKRYGGLLNDIAYHAIKTSGGYMICGVTNSPQGFDISQPQLGSGDVWIIRLDSFGNKIWDKRYGGSANDVGKWIASTSDGGFIISAYTNSNAGNDITEPSYGLGDY